MGLSQALSTGVSGLVTHQKAMDNIGNNLANVNTHGFKKGVFQFRTLLEQTLRGGMGADGQTGRGSINPIALGLGTQTGSINKVFTQGPLENTASPNDMAIEGNGFFVLGQGSGYVYTRDGSFYLGADGSLMGTNGLFVQGTMAVKDSGSSIVIPQDAKVENIIIPIGETGGMSQTSKVEFKGNLNSTQALSAGLKLFGGTTFPTVSNLQQWMSKDFNGGNPTIDKSVDTSWNSLEKQTFSLSTEAMEYIRDRHPAVDMSGLGTMNNLSTYSSGVNYLLNPDQAAAYENSRAYYAVNTANGKMEKVSYTNAAGQETPALVSTLLDTGYIPVVEEIKTVNGGNVQTSAAYSVKVPAFLQNGSTYAGDDGRAYTINNSYTYPQWFYESTGGDFAVAASKTDAEMEGAAELVAGANGPATTAAVDAAVTWAAALDPAASALIPDVIALVNAAQGALTTAQTSAVDAQNAVGVSDAAAAALAADPTNVALQQAAKTASDAAKTALNTAQARAAEAKAAIDAAAKATTSAAGAYGAAHPGIQDLNRLTHAASEAVAGTVIRSNMDDVLRSIWPNGINGEFGDGVDAPGWPAGRLAGIEALPQSGEIFPASLNTPLEHLQYQKGTTWVSPFSNLKDGDEITVSFKKGESQVEAKFIYNRPGPEPLNPPQQPLDIEQSYTLEHFLKFLAGDVDEPSVACQKITPAMFGAQISSEYPEGNPSTLIGADRVAYEAALANVELAKATNNYDSIGGAMGLLSIPPQISTNNMGPDTYDAPIESAGAYSRTLVNDVKYLRTDDYGNLSEVSGNSFRVSFVSNLGSASAISDIRISYNNVPNESMFSAEREYAAPQGGSSSASMTFYDSLGNPKQATVRLAMVSQDSEFTTWRWTADCINDTDFPWQANPNTGEIISNLSIGTGLIRFDKNGNFVKGAEYSETNGIQIDQVNMGVNAPIVIQLLNGLDPDLPQDLDFSFMTMSAAKNDLTLKFQNGAPPGTLDSFQVSVDGVIQGVYSNGIVAPIARLVLALVPNMNGLIAAGNNIFYTGPASGAAQFGYANLGGRGEIRHMQLETSNVDLSEEFTKLISIERGFQANSRTITTADEMLQELLNLKR